jgi:predicted permease
MNKVSWKRRFAKLRALFAGRQPVDDPEEEIRTHLGMEEQENLESGMPPDEAHYAALRRFGNVARVQEGSREMWGWSALETLLQDVRYGLRQLRRNPGFTIVAILTLALGIGANSTIYSVVNTVLLERLPVRASNRLVVIWVRNLARGWNRVGPTGQDYLDWKEQSKSFEDLFLFEHGSGTVTGAGEPEQVSGLRVTANFGDFFGIKPVLGRTFRLEEAEGRHNLAILGYGYWQRRFGGNPAVVGAGLTLNGDRYTIIGVLPASFSAVFPADVVVPFDTEWVKRADGDLGVFGRPKAGLTLEQASAELGIVAERIGNERPDRRGWGVVMVPLQAVRVEYIRPALLVLLAGVGFVLLIACVNVANLMLGRALGRQREVAIRVALGAGSRRLIRQFLAESTLLGLLGGGAGLLLAFWGTALLMRVVPSRIPVPNAADSVLLPRIHMDGTVVAFTFVVALLTGIAVGLVPALQGARCNVNETLKESGGGVLSDPRGQRTRAMLVTAEAALAFVLVIGAGLMIKTFWSLLAADPGFTPGQLLTLRIKLANDTKDSKYREPGQRSAAFARFLTNVEAIPGVRSAALTEIIPLSQDDMDMAAFTVKEAPPAPPGEESAADLRDISPTYFATMGVPLIEGRVFTDHDNADGPRVVIVDQTLAHHYFPHEDPIGRHVMFGAASQPREIVGVVGGVHDTGLDQQTRPTIYFPYLQTGDQTLSMVVRTTSRPEAILPSIKAAIWAVDKDQPVFNVRSMDEIVSSVLSAHRLAFILLGVFAFVALALAAVGIFGVTSYSVSQRTHEIGLRMALGANSKDLLRLVVGQGLRLTLIGMAAGLVAALVLTRFLSSILYGVRPADPITFASVSVLLTIVAVLASYIPARRATKVDPMVALRCE